MRVIVLPPTRAGGSAMKRLFETSGIECDIVNNIAGLCAAIEEGAASIVLSEEVLVADPPFLFVECLGEKDQVGERIGPRSACVPPVDFIHDLLAHRAEVACWAQQQRPCSGRSRGWIEEVVLNAIDVA
jgi:hypothetical protein